MDKLHEQLLGLVALDYESIDSIYDELCESVGSALNDEEIAQGLEALIQKRLVTAYYYSPQKQVYQPARAGHLPPVRQCWYMATAKGRALNAAS